MTEELADLFCSPSDEEESADLDLSKNESNADETDPSSPSSDDSYESKTIQTSPEHTSHPSLIWDPKNQSTPQDLTPGNSTSTHPPDVTECSTSTTAHKGQILPETERGITPELSMNCPISAFSSDAVSQYLLNQYLCQQLIALSRVNSMNGSTAPNVNRNFVYAPLPMMPGLSQMPFQLSGVPFQYPFYPFPVDMSMIDPSSQIARQLNPLNSTKPTDNLNPENSKSPTETTKKRRAPSKRTSRKVRPKVIPEKGSIQCQGTNRKKNKRCRNAALMEYIGPRPIYCAEHIHLDPEALYTKCKSTYQKLPGDKKGCREVVLKEFNLCHKHYHDTVKKMKGGEGASSVLDKLIRVSEILNNLEDEAMKAKKTDADLFQRKNKLIPKFHQIRSILKKRLCELNAEGVPLLQSIPIPVEYFQDPDSIIPLSILQTAYQPALNPQPVLDKTIEL